MAKLFSCTVFIVLFLAGVAKAESSECASLVTSLKDLKKAQEAVSSSLVKNHELMGETLASYSEALVDSKGKAHQAIANNMNRIGEAFKARGNKSKQHSEAISENTELLIKLAEKCISEK